MPGATSSFLLLVARPGALSSILAPSSGALVTVQPVERIANPSYQCHYGLQPSENIRVSMRLLANTNVVIVCNHLKTSELACACLRKPMEL